MSERERERERDRQRETEITNLMDCLNISEYKNYANFIYWYNTYNYVRYAFICCFFFCIESLKYTYPVDIGL